MDREARACVRRSLRTKPSPRPNAARCRPSRSAQGTRKLPRDHLLYGCARNPQGIAQYGRGGPPSMVISALSARTRRFDVSRRDDRMMGVIRAAMNHPTNARVVDDILALLAYFDAQDKFKPGPVGCVGHCMSGQYHHRLGRLAAAGSLYGVGIIPTRRTHHTCCSTRSRASSTTRSTRPTRPSLPTSPAS